jgi:hypothetical protein
MNPHGKEAAGIELPPPTVEQAPPVGGSGETPPRETEQAPARTEKAPVLQPSAMTAAPTIPLPLPATVATPSNDTAATTQSSALLTDDGDLIEKEWVNKAKQIVERTRDDPYKQSEELTVFKADYMKKRYGKTIKVSQ